MGEEGGKIRERDKEKQVVKIFFFQAEDGIRDVERSRGLGDVYKRQDYWGIYSGRWM